MKKILIVDDSLGWRNFHKNNIEEVFIELDIDDYKIDIADSAQKGYQLIMENNNSPYDLIVSDLQMEETFYPKYAGEWFIEQVKTFDKYFNTKIIICSGCYNIKQIAESLCVFCIPKRIAVSDINQYKNTIIDKIQI